MSIQKLLIANRGEISIRIARACAELGIATVAVYSEDDAASLHVRRADDARPLAGRGAAPYLDIAQIVDTARAAGCDAIHPGYGFLSENADFARACAAADILFVGPAPEVLELFGDKAAARKLAESQQVPVVAGTGAASLEQVGAFMASLGPDAAIMIKALAGGGGRGMRSVHHADQLAQAYALCQAEAQGAFGNGALYAEQLVRHARHIEIQVIGDGTGAVSHLGERECTLQRRNQKLIEIAPSPSLAPATRARIAAAALRLAAAVRYRGLGTFEFLLDADAPPEQARFTFMEANPRLQVEHTVTEEVTGVDLVQTQLRLAQGQTLAELGLTQEQIAPARGYAMQLRINMETMNAAGEARPAGGTLTAFEPPSGPGIRVDSFGYAGYTTSPHFDSLLAKLIVQVRSASYAELAARAYRALCEFRVDGVATNIPLLQALLGHPAVVANEVNTRFVEDHIAELLVAAAAPHRQLYVAGAQAGAAADTATIEAPPGTVALAAPMHGALVGIEVAVGDVVKSGQPLAVLEAMKMQHVIKAEVGGVVRQLAASVGQVLAQGAPLLFIEPDAGGEAHVEDEVETDLDAIRADLQEVRQRHALGLDAQRPAAVARRRKTGQLTARESIAALCDEGSFSEYGALALAAQRGRRSLDELMQISPADGLVAGIGSVNGGCFGADRTRCLVMAYDYTVFAGTQGAMNHKKTDRMLHLAQQWRLPVVFFTEGGGGRPGDVDATAVAASALDVMSFASYARLSGLVPRVGIVSGRCFAGNAALLGCSDVIIATRNATIGMGGPAMIEGGGLGTFTPEQVGPTAMQAANGVVDIVAEDDADAVRLARQYLSYFQGPLADWECADQRRLRQLIPENRLRVYDIRAVIEGLADTDSVLELRRGFGAGIVTALVRIQGQPFGLIANNPMHLGGAIDADAADKAARFLQLCDAFDLPIVSLCDTPGFMVGPAAEQTAMVRHVSRLFVTAASLTVPFFTIVLRKGYGLGAQAMGGGSFHAGVFTIAWPSAEFGAMGVEGAVRLGFRKELEAIADPAERQRMFDDMVAQAYEKGKAISVASFLEIDAVIDPLESRDWLLRGLASVPPAPAREGKKRPFVDTW